MGVWINCKLKEIKEDEKKQRSRVGSTSSLWKFRMRCPPSINTREITGNSLEENVKKGGTCFWALWIMSLGKANIFLLQALATFSQISLVHLLPMVPSLPGNNGACSFPGFPRACQADVLIPFSKWENRGSGVEWLMQIQYKQAKKPAGDKSSSNSPVNFQFPR